MTLGATFPNTKSPHQSFPPPPPLDAPPSIQQHSFFPSSLPILTLSYPGPARDDTLLTYHNR
ncbi:hypothetical protein E2C01_014523 [Portunus trituberculatus]|uniref:Uncharacterized protein n=1 Tax=Portunus trituberculatus TaxID=210409 RepID=A0A5B7DK60_PORTR|nr:hypothetical protein [Portunus trituberculatus]